MYIVSVVLFTLAFTVLCENEQEFTLPLSGDEITKEFTPIITLTLLAFLERF